MDGVTCGAPLSAILRNADTRSRDYDPLRDLPRPSHADYTAQVKYRGHQDVAGGGHFSGRLTAPLCVAGGVCLQLLARRGIHIGAHIVRIGGVTAPGFDPVGVTAADLAAASAAVFPPEAGAPPCEAEIAAARAAGDSVGGVVECAAVGLPAGLGDPMFDGLENRIAAVALRHPRRAGAWNSARASPPQPCAAASTTTPSPAEEGQVVTETNRHGGVLGGISSGMPLVFRAAFKPTPSIAQPQQSVSLARGETAELTIHGPPRPLHRPPGRARGGGCRPWRWTPDWTAWPGAPITQKRSIAYGISTNFAPGLTPWTRQMTALFVERMQISEAIGRYKQENHLPTADNGRERAKLAEVSRMRARGAADLRPQSLHPALRAQPHLAGPGQRTGLAGQCAD